LLSQKEEKLKKLGLNIIPLLAKATPKRTLQELTEDLVQYNPKMRFKSSGVCQGKIIDLIKKLHDNLLYISYDRFKSDLNSLTLEFIKHIKNEKYALGTAWKKSNTWVAEHAFQGMNIDKLPVATFKLSLYESTYGASESLESLKQAIENDIKKFVIFDDVIYTGSQMKSHVGRCMQSFNMYREKYSDLQLIIIAPYTTERCKKTFSLNSRVKLITTETVISSISEVIDQSNIELLNKTYQNTKLYGYEYLAYADWKVADVKSIPEFLHNGFKLQEGIFRFIRSPEPFYPPYKDRKTQELVFKLSSDPFENLAKVEFEN